MIDAPSARNLNFAATVSAPKPPTTKAPSITQKIPTQAPSTSKQINPTEPSIYKPQSSIPNTKDSSFNNFDALLGQVDEDPNQDLEKHQNQISYQKSTSQTSNMMDVKEDKEEDRKRRRLGKSPDLDLSQSWDQDGRSRKSKKRNNKKCT